MEVFCILLVLFSAVSVIVALWRIVFLNKSLSALKNEKAILEISLKEEALKREIAEKNASNFENKIEVLIDENIRLEKSEARMQEREKALLEKANEFEAFSAKIFESARQKFETSNKVHLDSVLNPLKENLAVFRKRIDDIAEKDERKYGSLETQINKLSEMNASLSKEAKGLATALTTQNKTAGCWGETVLERMLEDCGLTKNITFLREDSHNVDGEILRPDVVVRLPENRSFIIDSKVSLVNYINYCVAENEAERATQLKLFLDSVNRHIKNLANKKYENIEDIKNPDFVMVFMPIEGAFELAVTSDTELLQKANAQKIALVSPATLFACLRTVETVWRADFQNKNTLEIANIGGLLYDRIKAFLENFEKFGSSIDKIHSDYTSMKSSLGEGKGNIIRTAERLRELGAKTKGKIDNKFLERATDE